MKPILPEFAIVSVYSSENKESVNQKNHEKVLDGLGYLTVRHKELIGKFEGESEKSIIIFGKRATKLAKMIARNYNQECYLYCDQDRNAELVFTEDGKRENIGTFKEIAPSKAAELSSYTYDPLAKKYYSCG